MTDPSPPSTPDYRYELRIPKERIAILIGAKGKTKDLLEEATKSRLDVDSREGDVFLSGKDVLMLYQLKDIVKAIGRGFNPEIALLLLRQDYAFELIHLNDFSKHKNHHLRLKGRIIGREGKTREIIEQLTDTHVSVYGKTVGVIGAIDNLAIAGQALTMLLEGSPHATVYKWLEKKRVSIKRMELQGGKNDEIKDDFKKYL